MGTWGTYPSDNDGAWDCKDAIDKLIAEKLKETFGKRIGEEYRTATMWSRIGIVQLLLQRGHCVRLEIMKKCVEYFAKIKRDKKWFAGWKGNIRADFAYVQAEFKKLYDKERKRKWYRCDWKVGKQILPAFFGQKPTKKELKGNRFVIQHATIAAAPRGWLQRTWEVPGASWSGCAEIHQEGLKREKKEKQNG